MFLPTVRSAVHSASSNGVTDYQPRHACPMCAGQVMFDPYAAALTTVQLPEGTNVVPPKADAAGNGNGATPAGSNPPATMGCLCALAETFDWGASQRCAPFACPHALLVTMAAAAASCKMHACKQASHCSCRQPVGIEHARNRED